MLSICYVAGSFLFFLLYDSLTWICMKSLLILQSRIQDLFSPNLNIKN